MMGDNIPSPLEQVVRWEAIGEPGDFDNPDELDDGETTAFPGRAPFLRGYLTKDGTIFINEEYEGWVARETENAEGEMETRYFIKSYEGKGVQWCELSDGIKLIIVRELSRFMTLQHVGEFLDLTADENYAFAALCNEETERRAAGDKMLRRISERQFNLLAAGYEMADDDLAKIWEEEHTIWREEHDANDPVGPSTFSISKSEIQLAKRFLSDYRTRDDFSVAVKERKYLPTANDMEEAFRRIEDYEGTSTSYMDLDFDDFDGVYDEDEDDVSAVPARTHAPPASGLRLTAAIPDDGPSAADNQEPIRPAKRFRLEDTPYSSELDEDSEDESDPSTDTSTDTSIVVSSRSTPPPSSFRIEKKNPVGRPRGSTKKQKELQKSPRKKFAAPEAWDGREPPYHLLPKQKTVRPAPKKIVKLKLPGSKLSQFSTPDTIDFPSSSSIASRKVSAAHPDPTEEERRSLVNSLVGPPPPAKSLDSTAVSVQETDKAQDSTACKGLQSHLNVAISQLQGKGQMQDSHLDPYKNVYNAQVPRQPSAKPAKQSNSRDVMQSHPPTANTGPVRLHAQAQKQWFEATNAPALPTTLAPQLQATNTPLGQPQQSSHPPPVFCGPRQDPSKSQLQPASEGIVPGSPASIPSFGPSNNLMGNPHTAPPKSNTPLLAPPFYAQNSSYNQWLKDNPNCAAASAIPTAPDTSLERQKAHMYQNTQSQTHGYAPAPPAPSPSITASGKPFQSLPVHDERAQAAFAHLINTVTSQPNGHMPAPPASAMALPSAIPAVNLQGSISAQNNAPGSGKVIPQWSQPMPSGLLRTGFTLSPNGVAPSAANYVSNQPSMYTSARPTPSMEPHMRKNPSPYSSPGPARGSMGVLVPQDQMDLVPQQPKKSTAQPPVNAPSTVNSPISFWENGNTVGAQGARVTSVNNAQNAGPNRQVAVTTSTASFGPTTPRVASQQQHGIGPSNTPFGPNAHNLGSRQQSVVTPSITPSGPDTQRSGSYQQSGVTPSATPSGPSHMKPSLTQLRANTVSQTTTGGSIPVAQSYQEFFASSPLKSLHPAITPPNPPQVEPQRPVDTSPKSSQSPVSTSDSTVAADSTQESPPSSVSPAAARESPPSSGSSDTDHSTPPSSVSPGVETQPPPSSVSPPPESQIATKNINPQIIDLDNYVSTNTLPKTSTTVKIEDLPTPKKVTSDLPLEEILQVSPQERRTSITHPNAAANTAHLSDNMASSSKGHSLTASSDPAQPSIALKSASQRPSTILKYATSSTEQPESNEPPTSRSRPSVVISSNISTVSPDLAPIVSPPRQSARNHDPFNRPNAPSHIDIPASVAVLKSAPEPSMGPSSTMALSKKPSIEKDASATMLAAEEEPSEKTSKAPAARGHPKKSTAPRPASPVEPLPEEELSEKPEKAPATKGRPPKKFAATSPLAPPVKSPPANRGQTQDSFPAQIPRNSKTKPGNAAPKTSAPKAPAKGPADKPPALKASGPKASATNPLPASKAPPAKAPSTKAPTKASSTKSAGTQPATKASAPKSAGAKNPAAKPHTEKGPVAKRPTVESSAPKGSAVEPHPAPSKKRKAEDDEPAASTKSTKKSKTGAVKDEPEAASAKSSVAKPTATKISAPKASATTPEPGTTGSKPKAAKAAGPSMIAEVEDLEAQKKLGAPPPILNERSRSQARAVRDGTVPPPSPTKSVRKRGRDDTESAEETEVVKKVQRAVKKGRKN